MASYGHPISYPKALGIGEPGEAQPYREGTWVHGWINDPTLDLSGHFYFNTLVNFGF